MVGSAAAGAKAGGAGLMEVVLQGGGVGGSSTAHQRGTGEASWDCIGDWEACRSYDVEWTVEV